MNNLTATIKAALNIQASKTRDLGNVPYSINAGTSKKFTFGSGAAKLNKEYDDQLTIAGAAVAHLDLSALGNNAFGEATAMTKVKVFYVENKSSTQTLTVTPGGANGWDAAFTDLTIPPGGFALVVAPDSNGYASDGTHKTVDITNSAGDPAEAAVVILGE